MSSFRRVVRGDNVRSFSGKKVLPLATAKGVKPWAGGIHLTSTGLNDLDNLLGGGQPLGTSILLKEDRWTRDLALSLLKYWCAEAISQEQHLLIPHYEDGIHDYNTLDRREGIEDLLRSLPRNLHWDKQKKQREQKDDKSIGLGILEEDEEEEKTEQGLEIAWQYKKSVQQQRLAQPIRQGKSSQPTSNIFCHSYDLSGKMREQAPIDPSKFIYTIQSKEEINGFWLFRELVSLLKEKDDGKPIRLVLYHMRLDLLIIALPLFLAYVRKKSLPVIILIYSSPSTDTKSWSRLSSTCDVLLSTEGFSSRKYYPPPPEFRLLQGLLTISKLSTLTAATANGGGFFGDLSISKRPAAFIYGFKRDRRKLHIQLLHIPPEEYAQGGGSVGSGVRSGAGKPSEKKKGGLGCSSNGAGSAIDF